MITLHPPECVCLLCEALNVGEPGYREIAEELGSDDPAVIDPIWRARSQARIDACNDALREQEQSQSDRPVPSLFACVVAQSRRAA